MNRQKLSGRTERRSNGRPRKRHPRRSAAEWLLISALAAVFVISAYKVISQVLAYQSAAAEYRELAGLVELIPDEELLLNAAEEENLYYPNLAIDYESMKAINGDFVAVIHIPVLELTYPVVQTQDNTTYLTRTFEGNSNASGCIFLDSAASADFTDGNTFVFGHNMKNETMFGSLKRFIQDGELCNEDPYIYIYQEEQILIYRIFAYYTVPVEDDVYKDFSDEDGFDSYVAYARSRSLYTPSEEEIPWEERPNLITLSTCYSTGHVYNFVVQGALLGTVLPG